MTPSLSKFLAVVCSLVAAPGALADSRAKDAALSRLAEVTKGAAAVSTHKATGAARSIRLPPGARGLGRGAAVSAKEKEDHSVAFFREYGAAVGISDAASLRLAGTATDRVGETHLTWKQFHGSVPVYAGTVKTHFDAAHRLKAVTGTGIPDIDVSTTPDWSASSASQVALAAVAAERGASAALGVRSARLWVYRQGLAQGVPGDTHLAWEIEVTDGAGVRELVYVGAHTGKVIDRVSGIHDDLYRRAYDGHNLAFAPPNYPQGAYWLEGQRYPTASQEANNMIVASKETYDLFWNAFGRDSFDGKGAVMDAIFDRGYSCPNASWNGTFISFCPGTTADDVTAHEWGHAYTQYTHNLIYAWQPGALNESYSDIWGEVVDFINGRGTDDPSGAARTAGACSQHSPPQGQLRINAPASIAGAFVAQSAGFGPPLDSTGVTGDVFAVTPANGCAAITTPAPATGTAIALIDRGVCEFSDKVLNAQIAGYDGVIIANNAPTGLPGMGAGLQAALVNIPSLGVQQSVGQSIRAALGSGPVNATLRAQVGTDVAYRWLVGEDATAFNGAIRDMWNPPCYSNPGKVSDTAFYVCSTADGGGVHTNSGVPNHAFALLVDGGAYNGRTVAPIGKTKAAHIYFRAMTVYQVEDSDFADHADALEASCLDLTGQPLDALTGGPSGESIGAHDCAQVAEAIAAVEFRTAPTFCNFPPLLSPALPALCSATTTSGVVQTIKDDDLGSPAGWSASRGPTSPSFTPRDWTWMSELPDGRAGGYFAPDPNIGTCAPGGDESGVLVLTSPVIPLPSSTSFARATFEHWVSTEAGFDGGNLSISVNGGPWQLVPPSEFTFNNYSAFLVSAADGNTNPLAGQPAWTGTNQGVVKGGSWGRTHVNLGSLARPGDTIRLRFNLGTDGCGGRVGWYLDNVNVFSCNPNVPDVSVADISVVEGSGHDVTNAVFTVRLSKPTIRRIAVAYTVLDGTAQHGNDFAVGAEGTIVIAAGATSGTIAVPLKSDNVPEADEVFTLQIAVDPAVANLVKGSATATILNDD